MENSEAKRIDVLEHMEHLKPIFEQSYNFIVITTPELEEPGPEFIYVNSAFTKATGYSAEELKGKTPRILQGEKSDRSVLDRLKKELKEGKFFQGHTINYRKDGSEYWVEWNISPIYNKSGELSCYFCVQHDITKQMDIQKETQRLLEIEIKNRIAQEQMLIQQSKMAIMGEMIGVIAHQWQQPLSVANLLADSLIELELDDANIAKKEIDDTSHRIMEQVKFMSDTIYDFKNFFKVDRKKSPFLIVEEIEKVLKLVKPLIYKFKIDVKIEEKKRNIYALGHANEFKQVMINFISNVKDAYEERGIKDRVFKIVVDSDEKQTYIELSDKAGGIPQNLLPQKIFEAYVSTKGDKGSGIGMNITKTIIENNMNGTICVKNIGEGATFFITLPKFK